MAHYSILSVGDKLVVGALDMSFLDANSKLFPGTLVANGPVYMGLNASVGVARATVMIGPPIGIAVPASLEVVGVSNFMGVVNKLSITNRFGLANIFGFTSKVGASMKSAFSATTGVSAKAAVQTQAGPLQCAAIQTIPLIKCDKIVATNGTFLTVSAPFKQFNIPHPIKEGYRLVHTCLEGPEIGVYIRGKLKGSNYINLPDYWKNLVDIETITVNLTPHENYQELYYEISDWGTKIKVLNNAGSSIDCSYIVYAERKDVAKLIVEREEV